MPVMPAKPPAPGALRLALLTLLLLRGLPAVDEVAFDLSPTGHHDVELTRLEGGGWEVHATATDPWVVSVLQALDLARFPVLAFDYLSISGIDDLQVFIEPPWSEQRSIHCGALPPRQGWGEYAAELGSAAAIHQLRLDFGDKAGAVLQLRHLRLRARTPSELDAAAQKARKADDDRQLQAALHDYLGRSYASRIERVTATADTIDISATLAGADAAGAALAEWPAWVPLTTPLRLTGASVHALTPAGDGTVRLSVPRLADGYDRVLSRWVLVRPATEGAVLLSHARWADALPAANALPERTPRTRKGLGGFHAGILDSDLDDLGISAVTVNIALCQLLRAEAGPQAVEHEAGGRIWHLDRAALERLDATMLAAAKRDIVVLGIILIDGAKHWASPELGRIFQHPDYQKEGIFSMANVATEEGVAGYAMLMDLLAERYGRPDGRYGRVHHWIIHNEVDMGWVWTNCGARPELVFLDQYYKALRIAYYMARRHDPNARVYISLTQWWNRSEDPAHCHPSHALLDDLVACSAVEGDFAWGIAYHPYPDSLFEPKSWLDRNAAFRLDTPKITFRNLEVLDAWAKLPANRYLGTTVRSIHLSEQGPNSRDYSEQALNEQAASMAYVWKKMAALSSIEAFEYHNWIDNRGEGGLRIGLRRFPDDPMSPRGPKPVWQLYRALATPGEDAACAFALPLIGIAGWDEVRQASLLGKPR